MVHLQWSHLTPFRHLVQTSGPWPCLFCKQQHALGIGLIGIAGAGYVPPNGTQLFHFCMCFRPQAPVSEVSAPPPMGSAPPTTPGGLMAWILLWYV